MMYTVCYIILMIASLICASQDSVTINKSIVKSPRQWHFSTDYVRCFCNLPSCVTTGYMCKSSGGGCFSDVLDQSSSYYRGRHGCVELLPVRDPKWRCQTKGGNERTIIKWKENPKSLLLCCYRDMCNHIENSPLKTIINSTVLGDVSDNLSSGYHQQQETLFSSNSEIWFKAATIAVPICGAVILFVLIALAVKILKTEHQNSVVHKLGSAMYVHHMPQENKNVKGNHNNLYDNILRREYNLGHNHIFYPSQNDQYQQQIQVPLLLCDNKHNSSVDRNENSTESEAESSRTILEIEETVKCPTINLINVNDNYSSGCDQKKTENNFNH